MLSSTERKLLYQKKLSQGLTPDEAYKAVAKDIEVLEITERLAKNPKVIKAVKGLLAPLKQKGDTLTIK